MAFAQAKEPEKAYALLNMINPAGRSDDHAKAEHYRLEPYAVAGDISAGEQHAGRGGWSWYTGAAGWAWQLATRSILGLQQSDGRLVVNPCIPPTWGGFSATLRVGGGLVSVKVEDPQGLGCADVELTVDGKTHAGNAIVLPKNGETVELRVRIVGRNVQHPSPA
jgi:cyclic beta-1,2-glucan synthetase